MDESKDIQSDENVETEEFNAENWDNLEKEKEKSNDFIATDNTANMQLFIQNLSLGDSYHPVSSRNFPNNQPINKNTYNLCNKNECINFFEQHQNAEYICVGLILCIFEVVFVDELPKLKASLLQKAEVCNLAKENNVDLSSLRQISFFSLDSLLSTVQGKMFETKQGRRCVGLGDGSECALKNIWEQFPDLRSTITAWLVEISCSNEYNRTFDSYQIVSALARIVSVDFQESRNEVFSELCKNSTSPGLLASLLYRLYQTTLFCSEVKKFACEWASSSQGVLWKAAYLFSTYLEGNFESDKFNFQLKKTIQEKILACKASDLHAIALITAPSSFACSMLCDIFNSCCSKENEKLRIQTGAKAYVLLLRYFYYIVNKDFIELPLAVFSTKEQQYAISNAIVTIMYNSQLRSQLYEILDAYLKEISKYNVSDETVKKISLYFYNLTRYDSHLCKDVFFFLQNCKGTIAEKIKQKLYEFDQIKRKELSK